MYHGGGGTMASIYNSGSLCIASAGHASPASWPGVYSRRAHFSIEHGQYHQGGRGATPVKICPEALTENGTWYLEAEPRLRHQAQAATE